MDEHEFYDACTIYLSTRDPKFISEEGQHHSFILCAVVETEKNLKTGVIIIDPGLPSKELREEQLNNLPTTQQIVISSHQAISKLLGERVDTAIEMQHIMDETGLSLENIRKIVTESSNFKDFIEKLKKLHDSSTKKD